MKHRVWILPLVLLYALFGVTFRFPPAPYDKLTYQVGIDTANWAFEGLDFITDSQTGVPYGGFNYQTGAKNKYAGFNIGLAPISAYMATGDKKYLMKTKQVANFLDSVLPPTGLVPEYSLVDKCINSGSLTLLGGGRQAGTLEYIAYLAREDASYVPLMNKLAQGIINYGINSSNNLPWYQLSTVTGKVAPTSSFGYENQLGWGAASVAQSLLAAYETDPSHLEYKTKGLAILKSIWHCRNPRTNLIPETWDIRNNTLGVNLYPNGQFRYDDMGGAYIRALTFAYEVTGDQTILAILRTYTPAVVNAVWDPNINGGAFRYLTTTEGTIGSAHTIETMYGLFIASVLEAEKITGITDPTLYQKVKAHADNILMTGFGIKNYMVPHQLTADGNYYRNNSDSQLGYAVLQYPLGLELLSQRYGDPAYRRRGNQIINTLLARHKIGDNITSPKGYLNIVETQPPYGFELDYASPQYMYQAFFIPTYLLFNSIHPSLGVTIDWEHGQSPAVFGLISDMPHFNHQNVSINGRTLTLASVTGAGNIDLNDMGFGNIVSVTCDGNSYTAFHGAVLTTLSGKHSYKISWQL